MNRRNFVTRATAFSVGALATLPLVSYGKSIKHTDSRGFQHLKNSSNLSKQKLSASLKGYLKELNAAGYDQFSEEVYRYGKNYLLSAKKSGVLFSQSGHLFITQTALGYHHVFINEAQLAQLDEMMYSYVEGIKSLKYTTNSADFLLPHKILNSGKYDVCYENKFGNRITFKRNKRKTILFIS